MNIALKEGKKAYSKMEAPIGAIIVKNNIIIAKAYNLRETKNDATAHAEVIAIKKACKKLNSWRLIDCDLYVTLEPCPMCAGAIIQSRIRRLIFGATDPKAGACGSVVDLLSGNMFNHNVEVVSSVMEYECSQMLKSFFKELRISIGTK